MTAREEWFETARAEGGLAVEVRLDAGRVTVRRGDQVGVRVEADPSASRSWVGGPMTILGRVEEHLSGTPLDTEERARRAVAATTVAWDDAESSLRVISSSDRSLRSVSLEVTVTVPAVPALTVRAGAADVHAADPVGEAEIETTGDVRLGATTGPATVRCGAGDVRVGTAGARLRVRGGAGRVEVERVDGPVEVTAGAGAVRLGEVHADVAVRLAGGDVEIGDVVAGDLELATGAGSVRVGVHPGVDARLDLHSTAGRAHSELSVHEDRVPGAPGDPVRVRARTSAGDVSVGAARM